MPRKPKVDPKVAERRDRFARLFPKRVESLLHALKVLDNCSAKSSYEWKDDVVKRAWIEIAYRLQTACKSFGMNLTIQLDGVDIKTIDTSKPLKKTTKRKKA